MNPFHAFLGAHRDRHHGRHGDRSHHHPHPDRHCMHRSDAGGFGRAHGERFGGEHGLDGFERGRKFGSAELQLLILALLAERARHGYELIKEIEQRSGGWYVPSPGMVYPALSFLEDAGYASVEAAGAKKLYTISVAGLAWLDEHRAQVEALWTQLARFAERIGQAREEARFARDVGAGRSELHAAMHELRDALRSQHGSAPEAIARVVDIVRRAAAQVRGEA